MEFLVKSKSSGSEYTVKVFAERTEPVLTCTCLAGGSGQSCKHRFAIMDGDARDVVKSTHDVGDVVALLRGTRLAETVTRMRDQEKAIASGQAELKRLKKEVAQLMHGRL